MDPPAYAPIAAIVVMSCQNPTILRFHPSGDDLLRTSRVQPW
jgi:hypothetical protein